MTAMQPARSSRRRDDGVRRRVRRLAAIRHAAFWSGRFDLGNLTQAVWSTAHGHFLEITDLQGRQISRLGAHFDPIVAALAPLWRIWPSPTLLLVVQALAVAAGAMPGLPARPQAPRLGVGGARLCARLPALSADASGSSSTTSIRSRSPLRCCSTGVLVPRRGPAAPVRRRRRSRLSDEGAHRLRRRGDGALVRDRAAPAARGSRSPSPGAACSLIAIAVIVPHFAPGGGSPFQGRYAAVGGSPGRDRQDGLHRSGARPHRTHRGPRPAVRLPPARCRSRSSRCSARAIALTAVPGSRAQRPLGRAARRRRSTSTTPPQRSPGSSSARSSVRPASATRRPTSAPLARASSWSSARRHDVAYGPLPLWSHVPLGQKVGASQYRITGRDHAADARGAADPARRARLGARTRWARTSRRAGACSASRPLREARWIAVDTLRMSYGDDNLDHRRGLQALRRLRRRLARTGKGPRLRRAEGRSLVARIAV